jgi:hypothetical protein
VNGPQLLILRLLNGLFEDTTQTPAQIWKGHLQRSLRDLFVSVFLLKRILSSCRQIRFLDDRGSFMPAWLSSGIHTGVTRLEPGLCVLEKGFFTPKLLL